MSLRGNLQVPKAYGDEVDWLEAKFPNLHINVTGSRYIKFKDNEVLNVLLANNIGDSTGVTEADIASVTKLNRMFAGNTAITSFKEYAKFPITEIASQEFNGCTNLKELSIPRTLTRIGENALAGSGLESIVIPNTVTWVGARPFGQNSDYWKHIVFEDGFKTTYNPVNGVTGINFGKITKDGVLEELVLPDNFGEYI
ncbi:MAG: leucine-rich repeat domain-containing protein [Bacteroidales bacterium]|nr:leucine-rich repeat domain-containing protein [Bacteroidales bacterium]